MSVFSKFDFKMHDERTENINKRLAQREAGICVQHQQLTWFCWYLTKWGSLKEHAHRHMHTEAH